MNAPVMAVGAPSRAKKRAARAPAASLAGMRLWKGPAEDATADPHKPGCLAGLAGATDPAPAAASPSAMNPSAVSASREAPSEATEPHGQGPDAPDSTSAPIAIAEGGLEPHVSPYKHRARAETRRDSDILGYWDRIRGDRAMPAWRDLDQDQIAYFWPNSFLFECRGREHGGRPIILKATRVIDRDGLADRGADIAFTPPMVTWLLGVGVDVIEVESPLDGRHTFRTETGERESFEVIAMPLSADGEYIDHVLCHVKRR